MTFFGVQMSSVVAWGMLPLVLISGMPNASCICANGQRKLFCPMLWGGGANRAASCCCRADADQARSSDQELHSCYRKGVATRGPGISSRRCCSPELVEPAVKPGVNLEPLLAELALALQPLVCEPSVVLHSQGAADELSLDAGPPLDLVVALQRFLI